MFGRWYPWFVVVFWTATTGWFVKEKLLPPLLVGDPPSFSTILDSQDEADIDVAWAMRLNGQFVGTATTQRRRHENDVTEILSEVRISAVRLSDFAPAWLGPLANLLGGTGDLPDFTAPMHASSSLLIDPLGRPAAFNARLTFGETLQAVERDGPASAAAIKIVVDGVVRGNTLDLEIRTPANDAELKYHSSIYLPPGALLGDTFSPQTRLPGLRVGQTWKAPIYNPFRSPSDPMEILEAKVERTETVEWNGSDVLAYRVVFRNESSGQLTHGNRELVRAWVDAEGRVLRQEAFLSSLRLTFERLPPGSSPAGSPPAEPAEGAP